MLRLGGTKSQELPEKELKNKKKPKRRREDGSERQEGVDTRRSGSGAERKKERKKEIKNWHFP